MQTCKEGMSCSLPSLRFQSPEAHTLQEKFTAGIQYCGLRSGYIPDKSHRRKESFTLTPSPNVQSTKAGHWQATGAWGRLSHCIRSGETEVEKNASAQLPFSLSLSLDHSSSPLTGTAYPQGRSSHLVSQPGNPPHRLPGELSWRVRILSNWVLTSHDSLSQALLRSVSYDCCLLLSQAHTSTAGRYGSRVWEIRLAYRELKTSI